MMRLRLHTALAVALGALACSTPDDSSGDLHLILVQAPESATPGLAASYIVLVKVVNGDGTAVAGVPVNWSIASGGGTIRATADTSGLDGLAAARFTAGLAAGSQQVAASIYGDEALRITISTPALHADKVDAGYGAVCALQGTATWCWVNGRDSNQSVRILPQVQAKELALSDARVCVVDVAGATWCRFTSEFAPQLGPDEYESVAGLPPLSAISSGDSYFCGIAAADSTPWCWRNSNLVANQVSPTLRLISITAGITGFGCGLAEDGAAWCWNGGAPSPVAGGHVFRQISAAAFNVCAIEAPTRLYCWGVDEAPVPFPGASPVAVSMGLSDGVMNVQSGVKSFYVDPATAQLVFYDATFPYPALQISGDDNPCLIAFDGTVYCLGMHESIEQVYFARWEAIPAPQP